MSSGDDKKFYDSRAWRKVRRQVLLAEGFKSCVDGTQRLAGMHVDHIRTRAQAPELALDPLNLRVLTGGQHNQRHAVSDTDTVRQGCDVSGWPKGKDHPWNLWRRANKKGAG